MKQFYLLLAILSTLTLHSQVQEVIKTENGNIDIQPITHGTLTLSFNEKTIYIDPYGGAEKFNSQPAPDIILITDIHGDHLNLKTLEGIETKNAQFIVPQAVADKLPESYKTQVNVLNNGQGVHRLGFYISAIPMYNLPETDDSKHTKGRGNGYIINVAGKNIYISGDTEDIPEMRNLRDIDIAFVCMNLPYTMDITQAADAVLEFKPTIVYPYHYRGNPDFSDVEKFKELVTTKDSSIEVRLRDWYNE